MIDLSNNYKETANSYIIKEPGNYCLPLVYGCAIKNGKDNKESYTRQYTTGQADFLDYHGKIIEKAEIQYKPENVVIISWDSSRDFIRNLRIEKDYIKFDVNLVPKEGANYIIAIIDDQEIIIWSWHIWLWKNELKNIRHQNFTLLNVPLASKIKKDETLNIWHYQWGRKDPLCSMKRLQKIKYYPVSVVQAIQNPGIMYFNINGSSYNWITTQDNYNYWNARCKKRGISGPVDKTIYDPCPPGYHVPDTRMFSALLTISCRTNGTGIILGDNDNIFLPFSTGLKSPFLDRRDLGVFWSAEVDNNNDQYGKTLEITKSHGLLITAYVRINGAGIIPQKDDN